MSAPATAMPRVAVVGGGLAGLACASELQGAGIAAHVFDMGSRGPGGRASTRRTSGFQFDHGLQFMQASTPEFAAVLDGWRELGAAAEWRGRFGELRAADGGLSAAPAAAAADGEGAGPGFCGFLTASPAYVGVPGMDAVCRHLARAPGLQVSWDTRVHAAERCDADGLWQLTARHGGHDAVHSGFHGLVLADIMAVRDSAGLRRGLLWRNSSEATKRLLSTLETDSPGAGAPGTVDLGAAGGCELVARLRAVRAAPAFSLMVALPRAVPCKPCVDPVEQPRLADSSDGASAAVGASAFDAATVAGSRELAWVACDSSKPGRSRTDGMQCWVAVSTEAFARELIAAGAGQLPAELDAGSSGTAEARSSSGALPDAETRSAGPGKPAGPPGRPAAGARLPPASPALLGAAADALWPPLRALLARAHGCSEGEVPQPVHLTAQRWGGGFKVGGLPEACGFERELALAACGDFCGPPNAEGAMLSGRAAARAMAGALQGRGSS